MKSVHQRGNYLLKYYQISDLHLQYKIIVLGGVLRRCGGLVRRCGALVRRCGGLVRRCGVLVRRCGGLVGRVLASRSPVPGSNLGPGPPHSVV